MEPPEATELLGIVVADRKIGSRPEADAAVLDLGSPCQLLAVPSLSDGLAKQKVDAAVELFQHLFLPELVGVPGPLLLAREKPPAKLPGVVVAGKNHRCHGRPGRRSIDVAAEHPVGIRDPGQPCHRRRLPVCYQLGAAEESSQSQDILVRVPSEDGHEGPPDAADDLGASTATRLDAGKRDECESWPSYRGVQLTVVLAVTEDERGYLLDGPAERLGHVFAAGGVPHHGRDGDGVLNRAERAEAAGIRLEQAECGKRALGWIGRPTVAGDAKGRERRNWVEAVLANPAEEGGVPCNEIVQRAFDGNAKSRWRGVAGRPPVLALELVRVLRGHDRRTRRDHIDSPADVGNAVRGGEQDLAVPLELGIGIRKRPEVVNRVTIASQMDRANLFLGAIVGDGCVAAARPRRCHLVPDVVGNVEPVIHQGGLTVGGNDQGWMLPLNPAKRGGGVFDMFPLVPAGRSRGHEGLENAEWRGGPFRLLQIAAGMAHRLEKTDADAQRGRHHLASPASGFLPFLPLVLVSPSPFTSFLARSPSNFTVLLSPTPKAVATSLA